MLATEVPYSIYFDKSGKPLDTGYIYFGAENLDPETNPITVYWDAAGTQPVAQPVRTSAGYPVNAGTIGTIYSAGAYSITIRDKHHRLVRSAPSSSAWSIANYVLNFFTSLAASGGSALVGFLQGGSGAVQRTAQDKLREKVTSLDFGAKHDGSTDDTTAHQFGITYCQTTGAEYEVAPGTSIVSGLTITNSIKIRGKGSTSILKQKVVAATVLLSITGSGCTVDLSAFALDGQQSLQTANSTNDLIYCAGTGVSNGRPFNLVCDDLDLINAPYRSVAMYGDNDNTTRELLTITRCRMRDGSVNAINTSYTPVDVNLVNGVEAIVDNNDFWFSVAPTLPGGRCAVVVAQTQTVTAYYAKPTITNNRINYRGCNELASLGAIDLYIWSGNAIVENNTITNSTASAIKLKGNSYDFSCKGNKVDSQYATGGALTTFSAITVSNPNYGASASQFLIDTNQITNWNSGTAGVISVSTYDGATFSKNVVISKNQLAAVTGIGIDIANCQDLTVAGNEIDGRGTVTTGIRALQCDGNIRFEKNKVANPTSYHIYVDTPLTAALDSIIDDNTLLGANGTYAVYVHCRQAIVRKNTISGGFHGMNFGGGVQSAVALDNVLMNMTGTVGIAITSTAANVIARANMILDSVSIVSPFADSSTPSFKIEEGNSWNGQVTWGTAPPASGTWAVKDRRWNTTPNTTAVAFWECTAAGTPGTWKAVNLV